MFLVLSIVFAGVFGKESFAAPTDHPVMSPEAVIDQLRFHDKLVLVQELPPLVKAAGCYLTGCNGCGSYNNETKSNCAPTEMYCSWKCPNEDKPHNGCMPQKQCGAK